MKWTNTKKRYAQRLASLLLTVFLMAGLGVPVLALDEKPPTLPQEQAEVLENSAETGGEDADLEVPEDGAQTGDAEEPESKDETSPEEGEEDEAADEDSLPSFAWVASAFGFGTFGVGDPEVKGSAADSLTESNTGLALPSATIIETVTYENLTEGESYTVRATLMNRASGQQLLVGGSPVIKEETITVGSPTEVNGSIELHLTFNASGLGGTPVAVFVELLHNGVVVAAQQDISDRDQAIDFGSISTSAHDVTGAKTLHVSRNTQIIDVVEYRDLIPGLTYNIVGILVDKATGQKVADIDYDLPYNSNTFIPTSPNGTMDVSFTFDSTALGGRSVVAFEKLFHDGYEIAAHEDINDMAQTVHFYAMQIDTEARDSVTQNRTANAGGATTIIDRVTYSGLMAGRTYTLRGTLMHRDGTAVRIGGSAVTGSTTFTPSTASGSEEVRFTFDSTGMEGQSVVVFESLVWDGTELAAHNDPNDPDQTVTFANTFTVRYDENGGQNAPVDTAGPYRPGSRATILAADGMTPPAANRPFLGWNTQADGQGANYAPGGQMTMTADVTLYARWAAAPGGSSSAPSEPEPTPPPVSSSSSSSAPPVVPPSSSSSGSSSSSSSSSSDGVEATLVPPGDTTLPPDPGPGDADVPPTTPADAGGTAVAAQLARQSGNVLQDLLAGNVPLASFDSGVWSLLNLMMSLGALAASVILLARGFGRRPQPEVDEAEEQDFYDPDTEHENTPQRRWSIPRMLAVVAGLMPGFLFLVLEDLRNPVAWIDRNTLWILLVLVLAVAVMVMQTLYERKKEKDLENPAEDEAYAEA